MSTEKFANNATTTLNGAIDSVVTTIVVHSNSGFPTTGQFRILIGAELILVRVVAGVTWTVNRGIENTSVASHADNAPVTHILTAGSIIRNPGALANTGDIVYLDASGSPVALQAPAINADYAINWNNSVPTWVALPSPVELPGVIKMWGAAAAPPGYLMCDGAAVSRAIYSDLFTVIGTTFGAGDGATTFNVPNITERFPLGRISTPLGQSGGNFFHTHSYTQVPNHVHPITDPGHFHYISEVNVPSGPSTGLPNNLIVVGQTVNGRFMATGVPPATAQSTGITGTNNPTGGVVAGVTGNNSEIPPYIALNFIIKT